jgi:uncharacterized membrane protein
MSLPTLLNETFSVASTQATASTTLASIATSTTLAAVPAAKTAAFISFLSNIRFQYSWMLIAIPVALVLLLAYARRAGEGRRNALFFIIRAVLITLLITAIASPKLYESTTEVKEPPSVSIVLDESPSMSIYGNATGLLAETLRAHLIASVNNATQASQKISVDIISQGDKTPLGDELYRLAATSEDAGIIILLSDGNSNYGKNPVDVAKQLAKSNTTIYAVAFTPTKSDVSLSGITGDAKVTTPLDYQMEAEVSSTAKEAVSYRLSVYVDKTRITDMQITQNTSDRLIPLKFSLQSPGVHQVTAEITADEKNTFQINDRLLKTVEVVEKPNVLLVTNRTGSPLKTVLSDLYNLELSDRIPTAIDKYGAVVLDDINAKSISAGTTDKLREYVLSGSGLIVVGGKNSYDYGNYNNSYFETLLPVVSMEKPVDRRKQIAVVILMDISGSTEYGVSEQYRTTPKIDFEKALAIKILRGLEANDSAAVIAFNTLPYVIAPMDKLAERQGDIEDKITRLKFGGGTEMLTSLDSAETMLDYYAVNKYVIILSDGVIRTSHMPQTIEKARELASKNIRVYTVGVGFDTDEAFMQSMAQAGGGVYFKPEAYQRLNIEFGRGLEEEKPGVIPIDVRDPYHFITRNINLSAQVSGVNRVSEKSISQLLLTTQSGSPVLTVWNFGLGRVAALTTDDGTIWAGDLYQQKNNRIISSMTNWVIGDLEKNQKVRISTQDILLGDTAVIQVESPTKPAITIVQNGLEQTLEAKSIGPSTYTASFKPNDTGFWTISAQTMEGKDSSGIAVNYPAEYRMLSPDLERLSAITTATNRRLYYESELSQLESDVLAQMKQLATKTTTNEKPLYLYIIAIMIFIYFADAVVRRILDIRRLRE